MWQSQMQKNAVCSLLLVDDNRLVLASFSRLLKQAGYEVATAESADDAEAYLSSGKKPDLVIVDYEMPGRNGLSLAARLKSLDNIPFMLLSAYSEQEYVDQATQLGAMNYLVKPIEVQQLIPAIESALARANEIQELRETRQQLQTALEHEREINVAIGITMMQQQIPRTQAFEFLRKTARDQRRKLNALAAEVLQLTEAMFVKNKS
jgi:two-component system, response regulator PdtaR